MKAHPLCVPCLINQGLNAVRKLNLGSDLEKEVALRSVKFLSRFDELNLSPAYYAYYIQKIVIEITKNIDPFRELKRRANEVAMNLLPNLEKKVFSSEDPLSEAIRVSALGNYIDFAIKGDFSIEEELNKLSGSDFVIWDYSSLCERLNRANKVMIVGDNAGEIVFDTLLVRVLKEFVGEVVYAVKGKPILNDATYEDALSCGMTELCSVIDNGSDKVGTWLEECSEDFIREFYGADLVISKGQANFETLSTADRDIFFLLVAKCEPIALETGGKKGEFILKFKEV